MRFVILRHHQAAAGFLVEAMDDARSGDAPDAAQLPGTMVQQGVDEGVFFVARCRMHHQPRWLIQHQQGFVLI